MSKKSKSATEEALQKLHKEVAETLTKAILPNAEGEYNAAAINAAIRFLKDNNIEVARGTNDAMEKLAKRLPTTFDDDEDATRAHQ